MIAKYPMTQLAKKTHHIERLEVQSFEMNVYLVKVTLRVKLVCNRQKQ